LKVVGNQGKNSLSFHGTGSQDGYGVAIDNVRLIRTDTQKDLVVNGGF